MQQKATLISLFVENVLSGKAILRFPIRLDPTQPTDWLNPCPCLTQTCMEVYNSDIAVIDDNCILTNCMLAIQIVGSYADELTNSCIAALSANGSSELQ